MSHQEPRMIADLRNRFNRQFSEAKYRELLHRMEVSCGAAVQFRIAETPCFLPARLLEDMCRYGKELVEQLITSDYVAISQRSIPDDFRVPQEDPHPLFVQVDFGLVRNSSGALEPKLVELQGFPSLYAYQPLLARTYTEVFGLGGLEYFLSGLDWDTYRSLLRRVIVGDHDPENVILMEIDPLHQKTLPDFLATEQMLGIRAVNISAITRNGKHLFYERDGQRTPIARIYNRAIADELVRKKVKLNFRFTDELAVEWAGHPNWFFRMSKFSLPYLHHASVPRTVFLSELAGKPDLQPWMLKPLYSFAGLGIVMHPTLADLESIPDEERGNYVLQERMSFEPVIQTPLGTTKVEFRIMYIWETEPLPVMTILRMGRGQMMGVDHNKNMAWVGSSAGLFAHQE